VKKLNGETRLAATTCLSLRTILEPSLEPAARSGKALFKQFLEGASFSRKSFKLNLRNRPSEQVFLKPFMQLSERCKRARFIGHLQEQRKNNGALRVELAGDEVGRRHGVIRAAPFSAGQRHISGFCRDFCSGVVHVMEQDGVVALHIGFVPANESAAWSQSRSPLDSPKIGSVSRRLPTETRA